MLFRHTWYLFFFHWILIQTYMVMFDIIAYIVPLRTHLLLKSNICSLNLQNRKQLPNPYQLYSSSLFSSFAALPYFHHSVYQLAKKTHFFRVCFWVCFNFCNVVVPWLQDYLPCNNQTFGFIRTNNSIICVFR